MKDRKRTSPNYIMVTGASSGVGRQCSLLLAQNGYDVLSCVRREKDAEALKTIVPDRIHPVIVELRDQKTIEQAARTAAGITGGLGLAGLINCAGNLYCGPLEYFPREDWFEQYDVNLFGTMELTRVMLPLIRKAQGRIITIGGVGGGIALPFYGAIASSKIALEAVCDCLRRELHPWGIHVTIIEPGGIDTPANDKMRESVKAYLDNLSSEGKQRYGKSMETFSKWADRMHKRNLKPETVAKTVRKALESKRPKTRYRLGIDSYSVAISRWLLPDRLFDMGVLWVSRLPIRFGAWKNKENIL